MAHTDPHEVKRATELALAAGTPIPLQIDHKTDDKPDPLSAPVGCIDEVQNEIEPATISTINLVPQGDLIIVLTNFQHETLRPFVQSLIADFPLLGEVKPKDFPDVIHVRVIELMLQAVGRGFDIMFHPNGQRELSADGTTRIYRDDDDAGEALLLALCVIFHKKKYLPRLISTIQLADLCVVIDKYWLHEIIGDPANEWSQRTWMTLDDPGRDIEDTEIGLCTAYVLHNGDMFNAWLQDFMDNGITELTMHDRPFRDILRDAINFRRQEFLTKIQTSLSALIDKYALNDGPAHCLFWKHDCDATSLGSLIKCLRQSGKFALDPTSRFYTVVPADTSISSALLALQDLKVSSGCNPYREDQETYFEVRQDLQVIVNAIYSERESAVDDLAKMWRENTKHSRDA